MGKRSSSSPATKAAAAAATAAAAVSEGAGESRKKSRKPKAKDMETTPMKKDTSVATATTAAVDPPNESKQAATGATDQAEVSKMNKEPTATDATNPSTAADANTNDVNNSNHAKTISTTPKQTQDKATTKRQKRKQLQQSDKNKWPQHPHIKTAEAREQAYLRVAGLAKKTTTTKKNSQPLVDTLTNADMEAELRWGRCLASTEARTRHAAVQQLQHYLKAKCHPETGGGISELDLLKLCKALWYTLYLADHAVVQQELSQRLAQLLWCLAGTPEEDEYAGQAYLEMLEEEALEQDEDDDDDDDDDVIMQVIHGDVGEDDEDDDEEEEDGDEEEDEDMDDDDALQIIEMDDDDEEGDEQDDEEEDEEDSENEQDNDDDDDVDDSEIPHCRGAHLASLFVRTLFRTIRREWGHMDKYRIDKFYTLMRLVLEQMFSYMAQRHWNLGIIRLFNDTLVDEILTQTPNGLRNHLIDITLEELAKVNADRAPIPLTEATLFDCLEPYLFLAQTGGSSGGRRRAAGRDDQIQARVLDRILVKFLKEYSVVSDNYDPDHDCQHHDDHHHEDQGQPSAPAIIPDDEKERRHHLVFDQVHVGGIAKALFDMASDGTITLSCYRKSLYEMHKTYMKRVALVGRDVLLDTMEDDDDDEDEDGEGGDDDEDQGADDDDDDDDGKNGRGAKKPRRANDDDDEDDTEVKKNDETADKKKKSKKTKDAGKKRGTDSAKETVDAATSAAADDEEMPDSTKTTKSSSKKKEKKRKRELEAAAALAAEEAKKSKMETSSSDKVKVKKVKHDTAVAVDDSETKQFSSGEKKKKDKKQKKLEGGSKSNDDAPAPEPSNKKKKTGKGKHEDGSEETSVKAKELNPLQKQIEKAIKAMSPTLAEDVKDKPKTPESPVAPGSDESTKKKRKRNKRKGKQEETEDSAGTAAAAKEDVEVTISVADQKKAARAAAVEAAGNATSKTPPAKAPANSKQMKSSEKSKHVSFGKQLSKSYVSSITALRTMDPPPLVKKNPEEGILLNKDADPVVRRELLGKNLGTEDRRKNQKNNRPRQMQYTKSVWTAPMTMTRKSPFRKNTGGPNAQRNLPNQKRRKASDYF